MKKTRTIRLTGDPEHDEAAIREVAVFMRDMAIRSRLMPVFDLAEQGYKFHKVNAERREKKTEKAQARAAWAIETARALTKRRSKPWASLNELVTAVAAAQSPERPKCGPRAITGYLQGVPEFAKLKRPRKHP